MSLLAEPLLGFLFRCSGARSLGLRLMLWRVPLGTRLRRLGLAFGFESRRPVNSANDFFDLALDVFDDALEAAAPEEVKARCARAGV